MKRTKDQIINDCLDKFNFELLCKLYCNVIRNNKFPQFPWECLLPMPINWGGKEISTEIFRNSAKDICELLFDLYNKGDIDFDNGTVGGGPFSALIEEISEEADNPEILEISLSCTLFYSSSYICKS